jgi:hypothetical protein
MTTRTVTTLIDYTDVVELLLEVVAAVERIRDAHIAAGADARTAQGLAVAGLVSAIAPPLDPPARNDLYRAFGVVIEAVERCAAEVERERRSHEC